MEEFSDNISHSLKLSHRKKQSAKRCQRTTYIFLFERRIIMTLLEWAANPKRKLLVLRDARQVGKTTVIDVKQIDGSDNEKQCKKKLLRV